MDGVHSGVVCTLLDPVIGLAVHTLLPVGSLFATVELSVNFVRSIFTKTGMLLVPGQGCSRASLAFPTRMLMRTIFRL